MQRMYAFLRENASIPNMLCGNWVTTLGVHIGKPKIFFCKAMIFLSSLVMIGTENETI